MVKKMQTICPTEVTAGKFAVDMAYDNDTPVNTDMLEKSLKGNEAWYQVAKHIIDYPSVMEDGSEFISGFVHRPSEMLGNISDGALVDDILSEYEATIENFWNEEKPQSFKFYAQKVFQYDFREKRFKEKSDYSHYNDELDFLEANDPYRYKYFTEWMQFLHNPPKGNSWVAKGARIVRENLLKNSISSAIMNSTQLVQTIIPNAESIEDVANGVQMFINDRQNGFEELKKMGIGERTHFEEIKSEENKDKWIKFDVFQLMETPNQGIAYFIGKAESMRKNADMTEAEHQEYANNKNEEWNFIPRPGNLPRNYWNESGRDALTLMSYTMQFSKMYAGWWKDAAMGTGKGREQALKSLSVYTVVNSLLFGVDATIPYPIWAMMGSLPGGEELKEWIKKISKFSLFQGVFNLDLSAGLQPLNIRFGNAFADSANKLYDGFSSLANSMKVLGEDGFEAWQNPKMYKGFVKFARAGLIITPMKYFPFLDKTNIGGGQIGELAEFAYRTGAQDYERTDYNTKRKYETNAFEEFMRLLGKSRSESEKAYNIEGE